MQKANSPDRPLCKCHGEPMTSNGPRWACAIKRRAAKRRWKEANREKWREMKRRSYYANLEKSRETHREQRRRWCRANPEKVAQQNAQRLFVGGMYLGRCGFSEREIEVMLSGTSE